MAKLNLAEWARGITTLGPGSRTVLWVQGCARACPGCYSPEWQPFRPALLISPAEAAEAIAANGRDNGLTVSGGEPMLQAPGLVELWSHLKSLRPDWTLLLFSGYYRRELEAGGNREQIALLHGADAFVGGPYVEKLNDGRGLKGSTNKEVWAPEGSRFTPGQLADIAGGPRAVEYRLSSDGVLAAGLPPRKTRGAGGE